MSYFNSNIFKINVGISIAIIAVGIFLYFKLINSEKDFNLKEKSAECESEFKEQFENLKKDLQTICNLNKPNKNSVTTIIKNEAQQETDPTKEEKAKVELPVQKNDEAQKNKNSQPVSQPESTNKHGKNKPK